MQAVVVAHYLDGTAGVTTGAATGNVCPVPRAVMTPAVSGGRTVEPGEKEDF
jgi:hypothetical protein